MKAVSLGFLLLAVALVAPRPALGQQALSVLDLTKVSPKDSGQWVEYGVYQGKQGKQGGSYRIRLSFFVDKEQRRWMEMWNEEDQSSLRFPVGAAGSVFMKRGAAVYRVAHTEAPKDCGGGSCVAVEEKGPPEILATAVGALPCRRVERRDATLWISDRVPALKIAKARFIDGSHWELLRHGAGARSAFPDGFEKTARELLPLPAP